MDIVGIQSVERTNGQSTSVASSMAAAQTAKEKAEQRELVRAVKAVNASGVMGSDQELTFSLDRHAKKMIVKVVDRKTQEVLLQIPNEQALRMAEMLPKR
jgi:flagellar protein FlaG